MTNRFILTILSYAVSAPLALAQPASPGQPSAPSAPPIDTQQVIESGPTGSLAIRGVQGTSGGPEVGADEVEVVLFHQNQPVHQVKTQLGANGMVIVEKLPVAMAVRPVVRIKHANVLYQDIGPTMGPDKRDASIEVKVYETTDEAPPWKIAMRHLSAERAPIGLVVSEMLVVDNPADKTWLGAAPDAQNRRTTVNVSLPPGATDVQLAAGFHGWCCTAYEGDRLNVQMPLMPGRMTYRFAYRVPEPGGRADLRIAAPATTDQVVFMLPDDRATVEPTVVTAFTPPGGQSPGGKLFQGQSIGPNTSAGLVLTSVPAQPSGAAAPTPAPGTISDQTKILAGAAAGVIVLGGALVLFIKRKPAGV